MLNLKELYLHHNQLRTFPGSIGNLHDLKYLHVYENHLTEFPEALLKLKNLQELNISSDLISVFPPEIADYEHLKYIFLENNNTGKGSLEYEEFKWALKKLQDKGVRFKFDY
jgi:Leucine-rich repeat (LRR) protein